MPGAPDRPVERRVILPAARYSRPAVALFGVGLLRRVGIGKSRDRHAGLVDAHDPRVCIEQAVEGLRRRHLGDEADISDGRPLTVAESATLSMVGKQRLDRLQPGAEPMLNPGEPLLVADLQHISQIMPNARHDQRVRVGGVDQSDPAHPRSRRWVAGKQRRMGYFSSRYSRMASDWNSLTSPSIRVGTTICGLIARYSAANWWPFSRCKKESSRARPFRFRAMRTRKLACER